MINISDKIYVEGILKNSSLYYNKSESYIIQKTNNLNEIKVTSNDPYLVNGSLTSITPFMEDHLQKYLIKGNKLFKDLYYGELDSYEDEFIKKLENLGSPFLRVIYYMTENK
jgi:hypothetical protein